MIEVGNDHRLADSESLVAMLQACSGAGMSLTPGEVVRAVVRKTAVFGLFCEYKGHEILVRIPEISWIPSFANCDEVATVGDEFNVKIVHLDRGRNQIDGSIRAVHPENNPWDENWRFAVGEVLHAKVIRWVEKADRCGGVGGYLIALRPAALVMLCGLEQLQFQSGDSYAVRVTSINPFHQKVTVALLP